MDLKAIQALSQSADTKILMLIMDGLGGAPLKTTGATELETAQTPHLDALASKSVCGLHVPVNDGITPGSGPAHLALFGYDPMVYQVGRGTLAALGIQFELHPEDIAVRGNFCTLDENGRVSDRRAGRIETEKNAELCRVLEKMDLPGVELFVLPVKDYRFVLILRGKNLSENISDTDPQTVGKAPLPPRPLDQNAEQTAGLVEQFLQEARKLLSNRKPANMVLLRGFSKQPEWPSMPDVFGLRCAAIAAYPMYRGLARLVGMNIVETGETLAEEIKSLKAAWNDFDFFYLHVKPVDSAGEDGDFDRKVSLIEAVDSVIPQINDLDPDVTIVTGDHSTPALLKSHSWHPVPLLLHSSSCRPDKVTAFGEQDCLAGGLGGRFPTKHLMALALANAGRLKKFGA